MSSNPKTLLEHHGITPRKSLGQNFLHDPNALEKIVASADLMPTDTVLEIGPGTGTLTQRLALAVRHVVAVEVDERLRPVLEDELAGYNNVYLVFQDILETDVLKLVGPQQFSVVANVPYYITSQIIRHLLDRHRRPRVMVLTVQLEVAERILAKPGDMSLLAVSVQYYGKPSIVTRLKPAAFWPRPDVDSAVIRIDPYDHPPLHVPDHDTFFRVVRAGFGQKRKQLKNSLSSNLAISSDSAAALLASAGIDPTRRAETLSMEEWAALARAYKGEA